MTRGGKREGAGRPSAFGAEVPTRSATFKLPVWLLDELAARAKADEVTQTALVVLGIRMVLEETKSTD